MATVAFAMGMTMAPADHTSAQQGDRCSSLIDQVDRFLERAKLSADKGRPVIAKRAEAIAHRKAGRFDACVASASEALRLLGRQPL